MLEKTVLQQLQEIFPMEVNREEADAGEKIRLRNDEQKVEIDFILDGHLEQGYGYKNFKAYNRDVYETSYISEYGYEEYKKQIQEAINHYNKNEFTLEELADSVKEAEKAIRTSWYLLIIRKKFPVIYLMLLIGSILTPYLMNG